LGVRDGAAGKGPADIARTLGIARASVYRTLSAWRPRHARPVAADAPDAPVRSPSAGRTRNASAAFCRRWQAMRYCAAWRAPTIATGLPSPCF